MPAGVYGSNKAPPPLSVTGQPLDGAPAVVHLLHVHFHISSPGSLQSTTLPHIVQIFQNPIMTSVLALRTSIFLSVASFRLSLLPFIQVSADSGRPLHTVVVHVFVAVSITRSFLQFWVVSPEPNPLAWRTGMHPSPGPSPKHLSGLVGPARSIRLLKV